MATQPPLEHAQAHEDQQRHPQQHHGHGGRARDVVGLELLVGVHRRHLRVERDVARDQRQRSELAHRPGKRQSGARHDGRDQVGQDDPEERGDLRRAERVGGVLHLAVQLLQDRLDGPDHEGQRHEQQRQQHADLLVGHLVAVEGQQHDARHDRGQREGQVDDRVDRALARELVPDQHPRDQRAHDHVDGGDQQRDQDGEAQRRDRLFGGGRLPERAEPVLEGLRDQRRQRQQHDDAEPQHRDPERQPARAADL